MTSPTWPSRMARMSSISGPGQKLPAGVDGAGDGDGGVGHGVTIRGAFLR